MPPEWVTHLGYLLRRYAICDHQHHVSTMSPRESSCRDTDPKYRNGHILKWRTGTLSSFSASVRSLRGRPRPRAGGAWDFGFAAGEGTCRTS